MGQVRDMGEERGREERWGERKGEGEREEKEGEGRGDRTLAVGDSLEG